MEMLTRDVVFAARRLAAERGFTLAALLTLALGIGANTAMFSVVHGLLLRPLPYPDPDRIVRVGESMSVGGGRLTNRSMLLLENAEAFEHLAAYRENSVEWAGPGGAVVLRGATVSPSLFPLLRATPHLGRLFAEDEAREGADGVVLLSHRAAVDLDGDPYTVVGVLPEGFYFPHPEPLAKPVIGRVFCRTVAGQASDPGIVGAAVDLDGDPYTVVGVLPEGFYFPHPDSEFWIAVRRSAVSLRRRSSIRCLTSCLSVNIQ